MEKFNDSIFKTFRTGLFTTHVGENCIVCVSTKTPAGDFKGEVYFLKERKPCLMVFSTTIGRDVVEANEVNHETVLEECKAQGEVLLIQCLHDLSIELERPDLKMMNYNLIETGNPFVSYIRRNKFLEEIGEIRAKTFSAILARRVSVALAIGPRLQWGAT